MPYEVTVLNGNKSMSLIKIMKRTFPPWKIKSLEFGTANIVLKHNKNGIVGNIVKFKFLIERRSLHRYFMKSIGEIDTRDQGFKSQPGHGVSIQIQLLTKGGTTLLNWILPTFTFHECNKVVQINQDLDALNGDEILREGFSLEKIDLQAAIFYWKSGANWRTCDWHSIDRRIMY